jgi:2'-5' RNA ligase
MFRKGGQLNLASFPMGSPPTDRLVFMALPSDSTARNLCHIAHELKHKYQLRGQPFPPDRLHLSILHVRDYYGFPHAVVERLTKAVSEIRFPPVEIVLDRVMSFSGTQIDPHTEDSYALVLLADRVTAELRALRGALQSAMEKAGVKPRYRSQFKPHLTLLYDKHHHIDEKIEPIRRTIREFVLVDSLCGKTQYRELGRWPLIGRRPAQSASQLDHSTAMNAG